MGVKKGLIRKNSGFDRSSKGIYKSCIGSSWLVLWSEGGKLICR